MNDTAGILLSPCRRTAALRAFGIVVFLLGIGSAVLVYWRGLNRFTRQSNLPGASDVESGWTDGTLSIEDSKKSSREIELYYGKAGILIVKWQQWGEELRQPESLAIMLAAVSTVIAFGCFRIARRRTEGGRQEGQGGGVASHEMHP